MSFRLKTIFGVALIEACLLLVLVVSGVRYLTETSERELALRAQTNAASIASLIRDAVLTVDLAHLDAVAERALEAPGTVYVRIRDQHRVMSEAGPSEVLARGFAQDARLVDAHDGIFDVGVDITQDERVFGRVELGLSVDRANALIADAQRHLSSIAIVEMVLVALFSYLLGAYLTRGLGELGRAAGSISDGAFGLQVAVKGNDELAATGRAFNAMSLRLAESKQEMEARIAEGHALSMRLRDREQRLAAILGSAVEGFVTIEACGAIDDVNDAGAAIFGYLPSELTGRQFTDLVPGAEQLAGAHGDLPGVAKRVDGLRRDGTRVPLELSVSTMTVDGTYMFVALLRDMRDQLQAEAAARKSEAMRAAIVDANLDALVTIDAEDRIVEFSNVAEQMFGYRRQDAVGQGMAELIVPPAMREMHRQGMARYLETGEGPVIGNRIEVQAMRRDGELFPVELTVQPVHVEGQQLFIALVRDITRRKVEEQALLDAKQQAEVASEAKSRFLAHMSHEIRSPLNAVLGSIGLLLDDNLNSDQRLYARTAETSGKTLLSLINDILDFSKIEAGRVTLDTAPFTLRALVHEALDVVALKARDKRLFVGAVVAADVPQRALGDDARLRQVLTNLLDNAIKFTDAGTVVLRVRRLPSTTGQTRLGFVVEDTGIGISADARSELFEEFKQVDDSDVTRHGGTGLGLSICRGLVSLMGGCIGLDSEPGRGSRFWFEVPLDVVDDTRVDAASATGAPPVLAVGFPPRLAQLLRDLTRAPGLEVHFADDIDSLAPAPDDGYQTALVNGALDHDALERAAQQARHAGVRRLVLVSPTDPSAMTLRIGQWQFDDALLSPLTAEDLVKTVLRDTAEDTLQLRAVATGAHLTGADGNAGTILLVEDSPANRLVATEMLRRRGFRVEVACNGHEAVESFIESRPDLILMDLRMPEMNGLEATAAIRALPDGTATPIVAMTANAEENDVQRCFAAGMDDFVAKPVDPDQLFEALARHLPSTPHGRSVSISSSAQVAPDADDTPLLDESAVARLASDVGDEAVPEMLAIFLNEVRARVDNVLDPAAPATVLEDEAHTLKSCAGTFGARRIQALALRIEAACRAGGDDELEALRADLRAVTEQTFAAYQGRFEFLAPITTEG